MASFLARALALPVTGTDYFTDDGASMHQGDINRLAAAGIATGCGGGAYCPTLPVTRAQMASYLTRALGLPVTGTNYFTDDAGSMHESDINRVAAAGITSGCGGGRYCPDLSVTREQMAAFLHRALGD
jgi:S-layer homology domain